MLSLLSKLMHTENNFKGKQFRMKDVRYLYKRIALTEERFCPHFVSAS